MADTNPLLENLFPASTNSPAVHPLTSHGPGELTGLELEEFLADQSWAADEVLTASDTDLSTTAYGSTEGLSPIRSDSSVSAASPGCSGRLSIDAALPEINIKPESDIQRQFDQAAEKYRQAAAQLVVHLPVPAVPVSEPKAHASELSNEQLLSPNIIAAQKPGSRRRRYVNMPSMSPPAAMTQLQFISPQISNSSEDERASTPVSGAGDPNDKKERNKQSASAYRKRRKQYLDNLEVTVEGLQSKLTATSKAAMATANENAVLREQLSFMKNLMAKHNIHVVEPSLRSCSDDVIKVQPSLYAEAVDEPDLKRGKVAQAAPFYGGGHSVLSSMHTPGDYARHFAVFTVALLAMVLLFSPEFVSDLSDSLGNGLAAGAHAGSAASRRLFGFAEDTVVSMYKSPHTVTNRFVPSDLLDAVWNRNSTDTDLSTSLQAMTL